jgi:flagellar protein FlaF
MVLMKAAARLQAIHDAWDDRRTELDAALTYNRKLWTILVSSVMGQENPLPLPIRQNVANLGMFVFNHTLAVMGAPSAERLAILVDINRELAAGLRGMAPGPATA